MFSVSNLVAAVVGLLVASVPINAQVSPVVTEQGNVANTFSLSDVALTSSRWQENEGRTRTYLKFVDVNRMLYVFRANHKLSTNGAAQNGGWDAPNFPFRSHMQGHLLSGWAQCWATNKDTTCRDRAVAFVVELRKCQHNNGAAGFTAGYLSGFPESDFVNLEAGTLTNSNVPYYAVHKTLQGVLDVWRYTGDSTAKTVALALADWVDSRTSKLSYDRMQSVLNTEYGGMNEVLAQIYLMSGSTKYLNTAKRFDHAAKFTPLLNNQDTLNGNHANTNIPKWIGAAKEYKATGTTSYLTIAKNAWTITVNAHSYAIGANSQAEHFKAPNAIAGYLKEDTAEACNTYNMLKLTRELWQTDPTNTAYFDFYERALINHLLGAQDPSSSHGHITYFTSLNPGGHRGVGPAWGGGTWSTDYNSFWCCQGTNIETHTKYADSVYGFDASTLYINLFTPAVLNWSARGITVTQSTTFPASDTSTITITGGGNFAVSIRIPGWTSGASILVNGAPAGVSANAGSYAKISRTWSSGDKIEVKLPMWFRKIAANDNASLAAIAFGPTVLCGNYGSSTLSANPSLSLNTLKRSSSTSLAFTGTANGANVNLVPFFNGQGFNYAVYWASPSPTKITGSKLCAIPWANVLGRTGQVRSVKIL
ncbi:Six-hairpin glycosidase [Glarea lozoyensis ATCC 20868]|uniref:Six-hairpin glycosidase n=1 Tax=Glarea lozoyensis (strain ATCC 20868 / MF5171) TaxID=1116229 RepID=S3DAM7_GLAL2|nr:Six-hairpin glycosidase [Glarea lozoyensis ATCC 20868]EPE34755.1 Six-hairpin glycosidase [Glarea lozoyensis ATCC 20868]